MLQQLQLIFWDIKKVYKNFVHWNIAKILITLVSLILWVWMAIIFLLPLVILMYIDPISWGEFIASYLQTQSLWLNFLAEMYDNLLYVWVELLFAIIWFSAFIAWYSYKNLLFAQLNLAYIDGEPMKITKKNYFDFQKIWLYIKLLTLIGLILAIPVIVFIILFFVLIFVYGWLESSFSLVQAWANNSFSLMLLISFILCFLVFIYWAYRVSFSYMILMDEKKYKIYTDTLFYVKESFAITKGWKILKFIVCIIIFTALMFPFDYIGDFINQRSFFERVWYGIIIFLLLGWLFEMYITSIYRNIMFMWWDNIPNNEVTTSIEEKKDHNNEVL